MRGIVLVFNSPIYLFCFFPCILLLSRLMPGRRAKELLLCAGGVLFYAFGKPFHVLLLLLTAVLHYVLGRRMASARRKKLLCAVGILWDLALLLGFKYLPFFVTTLNALFRTALPVPAPAQPAGLSFFTFQAIAYLTDVYRGKDEGAEDFCDLLLYLSFFPRLIAGPLVRYSDHAAQLRELRFTREDTAAGLRRFAVGLAKKLLLADVLGSIADAVFGLAADELTAPLAWLGALAYTLQLYFDFSGYSDMSIGMGRVFGFRFPENFDRPYIAASLTEFWRRWHMTLSHWFRDYVYIPLGGNRRGRGRTAFNKLCVFLLTGLWHGAGWTFVLWGLWHGLFMMLESAGKSTLEKLSRRRAGRIALRLYTLLVVLFGFVLFRSASLSEALGVLGAMFRIHAAPVGTSALLLRRTLDGRRLFALLCALPLSVCPRVKEPGSAAGEALQDLAALLLFVLSLLSLSGSGFTPFIYAQF